MLVMAYLGQALTDAVAPSQHPFVLDALCRDHPARRPLTCEGHVAELFEDKGERRARLALTTKDENGEVKLAAEAVIAI